MIPISSSQKIYVSKSKMQTAGRGVFANTLIKKNEIIETCPIILIPKNDTVLLSETILTSYFYYFGKSKEQPVLVLGYGSIYNHSYKPNATYKANLKNETVDFIALRDIQKDEEIVVNYAGDSKEPLWFNVEEISLKT